MNFWNQLQKQQIEKEQLASRLFKKLGKPANELQANLAEEILKKITSYYFAEEPDQSHTIHSLIGTVLEISERKYKEGPKRGQIYYVLKLADRTALQAKKELLAEKWEQIQKMALLGQNLVFKYWKWFNNRQVLDFYAPEKGGTHD